MLLSANNHPQYIPFIYHDVVTHKLRQHIMLTIYLDSIIILITKISQERASNVGVN